MTLQFYATTITSSVGIANLSTTDEVVVGSSADLLSGTYAIFGSGSGHDITVLGGIYGFFAAIDLFGTGGSGDTVAIAAGATVSGETGIFVSNDACALATPVR